MTAKFDIITFDCYGTLIDWETGLSDAFQVAAGEAGHGLAKEAIIKAYHEVEPVVEGESYLPYRDVLSETARRVARTFGWTLNDAQTGLLADSLAVWMPFADTNTALERLKGAGYRLGILSNVDNDLLAGTLRHFTVPFDLVITAQQVHSYKPELGHFVAARKAIGESRWLHAAQSYFHDVVPAAAMKIPVAWINRTSQPPLGEARADFEFSDLTGFAEQLA
ncbi:MAG: HAD family hydrolase [Acidobacteriota bacterium]